MKIENVTLEIYRDRGVIYVHAQDKKDVEEHQSLTFMRISNIDCRLIPDESPLFIDLNALNPFEKEAENGTT